MKRLVLAACNAMPSTSCMMITCRVGRRAYAVKEALYCFPFMLAYAKSTAGNSRTESARGGAVAESELQFLSTRFNKPVTNSSPARNGSVMASPQPRAPDYFGGGFNRNHALAARRHRWRVRQSAAREPPSRRQPAATRHHDRAAPQVIVVMQIQ